MAEWLAARLGPVWQRWLAAGVLVVGLAALLAASVEQAAWVKGAHFGPGLWLALLGGLMLARSRFGGWTSLAYASLMLVAGTAEQVGRLAPPLRDLTSAPWAWVVDLHLRTLTLGERAAGWAVAVARHTPVADTGLFVALLSLLVWGSAVWLAWWAARRRQAVAAALPAGVLLAINVHLSGQHWLPWCIYLMLAAGLGTYLSFETEHADWDRRRVDYPGQLGLDWAISSVLLMAGIALAATLGPLVGTPANWRLLADLAARSSQQVGQTAGELFSGVKPPQPGGSPMPPAVVAWTPDLSHIGGAVDQSPATIMWVTVDDPPPAEYPGAPPAAQHYWRAGLYGAYTGQGWEPLPTSAPAAAAGLPPDGAGRYQLGQHFEIVAVHGEQLFAVSQPISSTDAASAGLRGSEVPGDGSTLLAGQASSYGVASLATRVSEAELRAAGGDYPAAIQAAYLQLPGELPARVRRLAEQIARGAATPYDRALRVQDYLRATYDYRLDVPPPPEGQDAVDYFLFTASAGYCNYFASAMAVMLRAVGVPARLATGYAMGEYDQERGAYRVPGSAAHAWVEVFFPDYGWVEFEPTPARLVFARPAGALAEATAAPAAPLSADAAQPSLALWLIGVAAAAAVAGGGLWLLGQIGRPGGDPRGEVLRLYWDEVWWLALAGLNAEPSETPDEYLQAHGAALAGRPGLLAALSRATELYRRAAYSQHPVSEAEAGAARSLWSAARLARLSLLAGRWLGGSGPPKDR